MFFDTKSVLLTLALVAAPLFSQAQSKFPFSVIRDSSGAVTRIELPVRSFSALDNDDALSDLRITLKDYQDTHTVGLSALSTDAIKPQTAEDKKTYAAAKALLQDEKSLDAVNDPRLDNLFAKAKARILQVKLYRLLAAPTTIDAFDSERAITEVLQEVLGQAGDVLGVPAPAYKVFEFLVDQYIDALQSRRDFYQNQMLVLIANDSSGLFTEKEKSLIRSSVFYSRLEFYNLKQRSAARKDWAFYGDNALDTAMSKCTGFVKSSDTAWGACFKQNGTLVQNRLVSKMTFSKDVSLAYDSKNPHRVRDFRLLLMLAHLGLKLSPLPSLATKPFTIWLNSQYVDQRTSEGYFYGYAVLRNQTDLADEILTNSANLIIRK